MEIFAIDDDELMLHTISMVLEDSFGTIGTLQHPEQVMHLPQDEVPKVILLDLNFSVGDASGAEGLAWVKKIKEAYPSIIIIILTAHGFLEIAVKALKQGANDFLEKPFANEKLIATVQSGLNLANTKIMLSETEKSRDVLIEQVNRFNNMVIGTSAPMQKALNLANKVAPTEASVLITGEHGTGKELLAEWIHQHSSRAAQPFVRCELSAISPSLFESTLFGHVKGAFTDASEDKVGLLEAANLGTLVLDEVAEISLNMQAKLLAALQNRAISRVGESRSRAIDIRVIAISHQSISELSQPTLFRQDLLFRINTIHIELPSLRNRSVDLQELINHFLQHFNRKYGRSFHLNQAQLAELNQYDWPGNIRELRNTIERLVIVGGNDLFQEQAAKTQETDNLYEMEKNKIEEMIQRHAGNISTAAKELGIGRNTLYRKMKKYGI